MDNFWKKKACLKINLICYLPVDAHLEVQPAGLEFNNANNVQWWIICTGYLPAALNTLIVLQSTGLNRPY